MDSLDLGGSGNTVVRLRLVVVLVRSVVNSFVAYRCTGYKRSVKFESYRSGSLSSTSGAGVTFSSIILAWDGFLDIAC